SLKYQETGRLVDNEIATELLTLKMRYQQPSGGASTLVTYPVKDGGTKIGSATPDLQFAAAVASFGMLLRNSKYRGDSSFAAVYETASAVRSSDQHGLRAEFLELVQAAQRLSGEQVGAVPEIWRLPTAAQRPAGVGLVYRLKPRHIFALG